MLQEYLDVFLESFADFRIGFKREDKVPFDERLIENITAFLPYRDVFVDSILFVAAYMNDAESYDQLFEFLQESIVYLSPPDGAVSHYEVDTDNFNFILRELVLYLVAGLIKGKRYAAAARFIESEYAFRSSPDRSRFRHSGVGIFDHYCRTLDEYRNSRLKLERMSVTADLLKERATVPKLPFRDLIQADLVMYLRRYFPNPGSCGDWYPKLVGYAGLTGTLELFAKATTETGLRAIKDLLKVASLQELASCMRALATNQEFQRFSQSREMWRTSWDELLNTQRILALG
jgi:hypothetical protein